MNTDLTPDPHFSNIGRDYMVNKIWDAFVYPGIISRRLCLLKNMCIIESRVTLPIDFK